MNEYYKEIFYFLNDRFDVSAEMFQDAIRYPEMWIEAPFRPEMPEFCIKCGTELLSFYGCGFDYDRKICGSRHCRYEIEFESTTEVEYETP